MEGYRACIRRGARSILYFSNVLEGGVGTGTGTAGRLYGGWYSTIRM